MALRPSHRQRGIGQFARAAGRAGQEHNERSRACGGPRMERALPSPHARQPPRCGRHAMTKKKTTTVNAESVAKLKR